MEQIITDFINQWGYTAIFILILLENVLPVVPSEIILTFAGLMSVKSGLSIHNIIYDFNNRFFYWFINFILSLPSYFRKQSISIC